MPEVGVDIVQPGHVMRPDADHLPAFLGAEQFLLMGIRLAGARHAGLRECGRRGIVKESVKAFGGGEGTRIERIHRGSENERNDDRP